MATVTTSNNQSNNPSSQFSSLYVGDLDPSATEAFLFETFNAVGPVASIRVCRDSVTARSLGYAYVNFSNAEDAERAMNTLNYTQLKGRACRIMWSQRDPAQRRTGNGNVFVKNLDKTIDNKALYDTFSLFGNILSCKVAADFEGKSRGFGYVHYESEEAATAAISKLNGMQLGDKIVYVGEFQKNADRNADGSVKQFTNIYFKHIPHSVDEAKLNKMFGEFGPVTSLHVTSDNMGRRFGFVNFEDFDAAANAVKMLHGMDIRSEEEKAADLEADKNDANEDAELKEGEVPENQFYVQRAQTKLERQTMLRGKFQTKVKDQSDSTCNLYVKNLSENIDDAGLRELFTPFGNVVSSKLMIDPFTNHSRGFGFVGFSTPEEATKAVTEMHLKLVSGKPLYVCVHEKKEQRVERLQQTRMRGQYAARGPGGMGYPPMVSSFPARPMNMPMYMGQMGGMQGGYPMARPSMPYGQNMMPPMRPGPAAFGKGKGGPSPMVGGPMGPVGMGRPVDMGPMGRRGYETPLTAAGLAAAPPNVQKQMLGEKLFPLVSRIAPEMAGKITGMMLEMDNSELLILLESDQQLQIKVSEALHVLGNK